LFCLVCQGGISLLWRIEYSIAKESNEWRLKIITYQFLDFGDGKPPVRGFVCASPNAWSYPAKDRSGRLGQIEEPHLGKLLTKLTNQHDSKPKGEPIHD
jgi:hypothetical protein